MPKLNDTQTILLSVAAQRADHSLLPLPDTITAGARVNKAITSLFNAALVDEQEVTSAQACHRTEGDLRYGVFATAAGLAAIGIVPEGQGSETVTSAPPEPRINKTASVIALLQRETGATLPDLIAATGWLPHTTRAALTGLRKKGHAIERFRSDEVTCYRIAG